MFEYEAYQPRKPSEFISNRNNNPGKPYLIKPDESKRQVKILEFVLDKEKVIRGCEVPIDKPIFQPEPSTITIQGFIPFKTYELVVTFRNVDKVGRKIRLEQSNCPYFSVIGWKSQSLMSERVAPGMDTTFVVKFTPEEKIDYMFDLICITEREKFSVPIKAIGARGLLDISDEVTFGECPVRFKSFKNLLVRNIGDATARITFDVQAPFSVSQQTMTVEKGESSQLQINFSPKQIGSFQTDLLLKYDTGEIMLVKLYGSAENINVKLEKNKVQMDNTWINLMHTKKLSIINRSDKMVSYKWKQYSSELEEEHYRSQALLELAKEEAAETEIFHDNKATWDVMDLSILHQTYKNKARELNDLPYLFNGGMFSIHPMEGTIWPESSMEITVHFQPEVAGEFTATPFCEIEGRESRLPLQLKGTALGPKVKFSYTEISIRNVFVCTNHKYTVILENEGSIPSKFSLVTNTSLFGSMFKFNPSEGVIASKEQKEIEINFISNSLGSFVEQFYFQLAGGVDPLYITIDGTVIGPTFHFESDSLTIPNTSLGFTRVESIDLVNTSVIPMEFSLRWQNDDDESVSDIVVTPQYGNILPESSCTINVQFCPRFVKKYEFDIIVDIPSIESDLSRLKVQAESLVPEIGIKANVINLHDCFLDYEYDTEIDLINSTEYPARYEIMRQDASTMAGYIYSCTKPSGIILPNSESRIPLKLQFKRLGTINSTIFVKILGNNDAPLLIDLTANGIGPEINIQRTEIDWGKIPVLAPITQILKLSNQSPIPAYFNCSTVSDHKIFKVEPISGKIDPNSDVEIQVTAFLDDSSKFSDILKISIAQCIKVHEIRLIAKGQGSTICFDEGLRRVDFGDVFSNCECTAEFVMVNRGRRTQAISWIKDEPKYSSKQLSELCDPIFEVIPQRFTLKPGSEQTIILKGCSHKAMNINEKLICQATIDKDPTRKQILESIISVNFINPLIEYTPSCVRFESFQTTEEGDQILTKTISMKNTTTLPLTIFLKCPKQFTLLEKYSQATLKPNETIQVEVSYSTAQNFNRVSTKEFGKLLISYKEHPQKDSVELISDINFPNLFFTTNTIKFGCIPIDVEQRQVIKMQNTSVLPVSYQWYFLETDDAKVDKNISQVFDIQPLAGILKPQQIEDVEVYFYGQPGTAFNQRILCDVQGGPKYELRLQGEASKFEYHFDKNSLDFGDIPYQTIGEKDFTLFNDGLVSFEFNVSVVNQLQICDKVLVYPSSGVIESKCSQKIVVKFCPVVPEAVQQSIYVQIAHNTPDEVAILARPTFPRLSVSLPIESGVGQNLDMEMQRSLLTSQTLESLGLFKQERKLSSEITEGACVGSKVLFSNFKPNKPSKSLVQEFAKVVHQTYICNFGTVVKNSTVKKVIVLNNPGKAPVSFSVDRDQLEGTGFSVDLEKVKGLPAGDKVELCASFNASQPAPDQKVALMINLAGGPMIKILFAVAVTIPSLTIHNEKIIDFGEVLMGYRKTLNTEIQNPSLVSCEWSVIEDKRKSSKDFEIIPKCGILSPLENMNISIRFTPTEGKAYDCFLHLKVHMNSKPYEFHLNGIGIKPMVSFTPSEIIASPSFPFSEGSDHKVVIENQIDYPIEVYSVENDAQYLEDEEILKMIDGFDTGAIYLPPKPANVSLIDHLMECKVQLNKPEDAVEENNASVGEIINPRISKSSGFGSADLEMDQPHILVLHGAPFAGKTTQAKRIASAFNREYIRLDDFVKSYCKISNAEIDESVNITVGSLTDIFKSKFFASPKDKHGYVIDGLDCTYMPSIAGVLRSLLKFAAEKNSKLILFNLNLDLNRIKDRDIAQQKSLDLMELESFKVKELTEEEYDKLSEVEKGNYDKNLLRYKKKLKEVEEKERQRRVDELMVKLGDKKMEDDKLKMKKQRSRQPTVEKSDKVLAPAPKIDLKKSKTSTKPEKTESKLSEKDREEDVVLESFANPVTFNRVESYLATCDQLSSLLRDSYKSTQKSSTITEKKSKNTKTTAATPDSQAQNMDLDSEENPFAELYDFNVSGLDEETIFKALCEHIPVSIIKEEDMPIISPDFILEKAFYYPSARPRGNFSKAFVLISPPEADEQTSISKVPSQLMHPIKPPEMLKKGGKLAAKIEEKLLDVEEEVEKETVVKYRWILQPKEKKELTIKFCPSEVGKLETKLKFEIVGLNHQFELPCSGICRYPQIGTDHKKIFNKWRKSKPEKSIVYGEYVMNTNTYDFGPLLQGRNREKCLEKYPENQATLQLSNPGNTDLKVEIFLKNDYKGDIFFFEPQSLDLAPGQTQSFNLWAYPKSATRFEDMVILNIKDNPEPVCFKVQCTGVKPDIELDKKFIAFDKLLVGRLDKKELKLKNTTLLPVMWRLTGLDSLGDEFALHPSEGQIESNGETIITAEFRGIKAAAIKKIIRIEIADGEKSADAYHDIPIVVTAEAYDISMDIHFPRGFEGGLDFGVLKVGDEGKQISTLKNKGKYEVGFRFIFDNAQYNELFVITPSHGIIQPSEKPFSVQIIFTSKEEIHIKDLMSLKCIVFEPSTGEITASIPVKISAKAVFSKFAISPARDLNFGGLIHGTKVNKQFFIENLGEFDFKFSIYKIVPREKVASKTKGSAKVKQNKLVPMTNLVGKSSHQNSNASTNAAPNKKELVKQPDAMSFGAFAISMTSGTCPANTKLPILVDFQAEAPGFYEELIGIDISERSPADADVVEYKLIGESCLQGINTTDFSSIFEDQTVCKRLEAFHSISNVYAEDDRVFYFGAYLVGQQAQVHLKISNPFKVACDVNFTVRPRGKSKAESSDFAFEVEPKKLNIPSHEHRYITISFHPWSIQPYVGLFEAVVENVMEGKNRMLGFELRGEGTLPRVIVEKPIARSKTGVPLLRFKKLLVDSSQTLFAVLKNDGIIPAKFKLEWSIKDSDDFECPLVSIYHSLKPQEIKNIEVKFKPNGVKKIEAELRLKIADNPFEDYAIQITGEGYIDDITFDGLAEDCDNEVIFNDCFINEKKHHAFKVHNHSNDFIRVAFTENPDFSFVPSICHIRPGSDHDVTITFLAKQPCDIQKSTIPVKVQKIKLVNPSEHDWDDKLKIVKWIGNDKSQQGKKVVEHLPEPQFESLSLLPDYTFLASGFADYSAYECDVTTINFKSTLMYQTRVYRFPLKNSGKVVLKFALRVMDSLGVLPIDPDECPFDFFPSSGLIPSGESTIITVKFNPQDVDNYKFTILADIQNLVKEQKPLSIMLSGSSIRPFCHFELEDNDYLLTERNASDKIGIDGAPHVLEPNTKVIEFRSCGVRSKNTKKFYIMNPTHLNYEFVWKPDPSSDASVFKCLTLKGMVASNKKSEIVFEFTPDSIDEALWHFSIPEHNIRIPFLLIGNATEPTVYLSQPVLNFKAVLVGRQVKERIYLTNDESTPFYFAFNETSVDLRPDGAPVLKLSPLNGIIAPNSKIPIDVLFSPASEKTFNFNLSCNVRKKPTPLKVNIKGEGYEIHENLQIELADGSIVDLAKGIDSNNILDFGQVQVNEKRSKRVCIINSGKVNFDFSWKGLKRNGTINIVPEIGTVGKGDRVYCDISFLPNTPTSLKNIKVVCHIINSGMYSISLLGNAMKPLLKLSKTSIDFGTHLTVRPGTIPATMSLEITNQDTREISFELIANDCSWFDIQKGASSLLPNETTKLTVKFTPRDSIVYSDIIKVEINGLSAFEIPITGEGSELKLEADQRVLNFGALRIDHTTSKIVKITNRSKIPVKFSLPHNVVQNLSSLGFVLSHVNDIFLRPKGSINIEIKFTPRRRISPFSEEIYVEALGITRMLFIISGACQGTDIRLETETLPFGAVVQKSFTVRKIQLQNIGDIGAKFAWDVKRFVPDFSITPADGYISPGMEIPLEISFHPSEINSDIRVDKIACEIEGMQPIYITLTGMCVPQPFQTDVIKFHTPVRTPETKTITLTNRTPNAWHISPIIDNDFWKGPIYLDIDPGQTKSYDISFIPLETIGSGEGGRHEGSIFFPIPDGTGVLYKLNGTVDKPVVVDTISREITCKTNFTETLPIYNWLRKAQRFKVITELSKPDPGVVIKGHEFIDVPALQTKDYRFTYYAYKDGPISLKMIFKNEATQEYLFYNLNYKGVPSGVISTIEITGAVRQLQTREISIYNPLSSPVVFTGSSSNQEVSVTHSLTIQPRSESVFVVEYLPLMPKEGTCRITLTSADLGSYFYDIKLVALPCGMERPLNFRAGLGASQTQTFRFISYAKTKTEYSCKIDNSEFTVDKSVIAPAATSSGVEVSVDITFEPSRLGDFRTQLCLNSSTGGDYICPLQGQCVAPRPSGPVIVRSGAQSTVSFKNVFNNNATFNFVVDNPSFIVKASETIPSKKTVQLSIGYKNAPANEKAANTGQATAVKSGTPSGSSKTGKLTITNQNTSTVWIYYLKYVVN